jgi:uncharacterized protein (TIGR02996 family)
VATRESFLDAIIQAPEDDAVRLVFSDWLEENGEPERAEFIRLQVALAAIPPDAPRDIKAEEREAALLTAYRLTWMKELPRWVSGERVTFRRGFVARIPSTSRRFLDKGGELFAATPLEGVHLRRVERDLEALSTSPHVARLRSLDLTRNVLRHNAVARLAAVEEPCQLTELVLDENYIDGNDTRTLLESEHLARLERLSLRRTLMQNLAALTLAQTPNASRLRALNLHDNRLGDRGLQGLAESPHLTNLTDLDLGYTQITTAGLAALAGTPLLARLTRLGLGSNFTNIPRAAETIAGLDHHFVHLDLSHTHPGDEGAIALANSPASASLRTLNLHCCGVKSAGMIALAESPYLANLSRLDLSTNFSGKTEMMRLRERFGTRVNF